MPLTRLPLTTGVSGTLPIANGGTNVTTAANLANTGNMVLIKTQTVSSNVASLEFKNGVDGVVLDNTYKYYKVIFRDVFGDQDEKEHNVRISTDGGSNYLTTNYLITAWRTFNNGNTTGTGQNTYDNRIKMLNMFTSNSLAEGTHNGELSLWNPSETGKNPIFSFISQGYDGNYAINSIGHGTHTTDQDFDAIKFYMSSGNISGGSYTLYGVKE